MSLLLLVCVCRGLLLLEESTLKAPPLEALLSLSLGQHWRHFPALESVAIGQEQKLPSLLEPSFPPLFCLFDCCLWVLQPLPPFSTSSVVVS